MSDLDLTPEAVEAHILRMDPHKQAQPTSLNADTFAILRALSERLAEVEAERDSMWKANLDLQRKRDAAEAALAAARADALREAAEICDDLAIGYAKHVGAPTALLDAKRDILALIPKEQTNDR